MMKIVWDERHWLASQGLAYGTGSTRWAAFWDCMAMAFWLFWDHWLPDRLGRQ